MKRMLALLLVLALAQAEGIPLYSSSYANALENKTTYTFRTQNLLDSPTSAFRIRISSDFSWFYPPNFTYPFPPDYMDDESAYWDIPPLLPNETAEVSFTVNRLVGLPEEIDVRSEIIRNWSDDCAYFKPINSSAASFMRVQEYLQETNRSQGMTGYFEEGGLLLVRLDAYGSFAVFSINESGASPVSDGAAIDSIIESYARAGSPGPVGNASALYQAVKNTKSVKFKAEHECYLLTGMANYPCVDRETCLYACFSVPVCSLVGQSGWSFMDTILDYNKSVTEANSRIAAAEASSGTIDRKLDYFTAKAAFDDLVALNRAESAVMFHPLITSYGFCEPPNYGLPVQISARRQLLDYLGSTCLAGEAVRMKEEARRGAPLLSQRPPTPIRNESAQVPELINITENHTFEITAPAQDKYTCCAFGQCSLFGIERMGGLCWEWGIAGSLLFIFALLLAWRASG